MEYIIPFNKPFLTGRETAYIQQAVDRGKLSGNGEFTQRCQWFFQNRYGFGSCFLINSCTAALEMAALLLNIKEGDEVIMPAYTFVSTANAFVLRGAKPVFVDSRPDHPGMDEYAVEGLITPKTKAIVAVHYAGVACDMDLLMNLAEQYGIYVVEDAAQAIDGYYNSRPLGSIGHLAAFSFHETKNIQCGEGGMLVVNDPEFAARAEILWEKGTNRAAFRRNETRCYQWMDIGSSFFPSEITAAFLFAQLECLEAIQQKRKKNWEAYQHAFDLSFHRDQKNYPEEDTILNSMLEAVPVGADVRTGVIPPYASNNAHMFYLVFDDPGCRTDFIRRLSDQGILAIFHYLPLHLSPYFKEHYAVTSLPQAERYGACLVRLPLYYGLDLDKAVYEPNNAVLRN